MFRTLNYGLAPFAISILIATPSAAATTFTDTTFNPSDYGLAAYAAPGVTTTFGQTASGNLGTALQATFSAPGANPAGELFTALNTSFIYNPTVSGAITSLDVSLDRYFNPVLDGNPANVGSYTLRVLAQQAGNLYQAIYTFGPLNQPGGNWYSLSQSGLLASDFKLFDPLNYGAAGSTTGLDYTAGAITFGFAMRAAGFADSTGAPSTAPSSGTLRADNFIVTIGSVPEPSTWAMMIVGFGITGLSLRARRRMPRAAIA